ncbi:oligoendopeptidase [Peptoclostridium acidaminophilum DSM 3953]|uniref:Oligopeptidase F n=1 Tax=Peptoclostridium acidaminophilum DSM 3953 TaxID=1286171 RepID=W8TGE4_PEPAC|nr:oligoendopeptidase F [Peptoclostridium acidaminophilum]AHM56903.1 oligoendopeptidase [Peptoclostridium acidaminophilum DSM 3953]
MDRTNIEAAYKWDIESFFNDESFEANFERIEGKLSEVESYKGRLSGGEDVFCEFMALYEELMRGVESLYVYSHMKKDEDSRDSKYQALAGRSEMLSTRTSTVTSFVVPEIIQMKGSLIKRYLQDERIKLYERYIDEIIRKKPYTLSQNEERILALAGDISNTAENAYEMLSFADLKFPMIKDEEGEQVRLTHANFMSFMKNKNRSIRKDAFEKIYSTYSDYKNTYAAMLCGSVKREIFHSKSRGYGSAIEASLFQDNISLKVYDNLIEAVSSRLEYMHQYMDVKKRLLGVDELHMYDLYAPLVEEADIKITYDKAKEIIISALQPLGEEYLGVIKKAFDERWIDVYENEGKKGGAYSWGSFDSKPFILMNYKDDINSLFTLAHELGHSVHSYYSRKSQPYIYSHYKIFVAEVASTLNELLLMDYMLKNSKDKNERIYLLNYHLEQFRTTLFRQTMFAEFEKIIHARGEEGKSLTNDDICGVYYELNRKYYGEGMSIDKEIAMEWARVPHFYSNFYVYKYATGFSAAAALSSLILDGDSKARGKYIEFLKSGGSEYPLDQLRSAGVEMEQKESIIRALDRLESILRMMQQDACE